MRKDWDDRARRNAMHYIANNEVEWDIESFYRAGMAEAIALVKPTLITYGLAPQGKRVLEIGCGIGRLFPGFSELGFKEIWGVDISPLMIEQGRQSCPVRDANFVLGTGRDLGGLEDGFFDYVFEYIVFQHIPDKKILSSYMDEVYRVLRVEGVYQLQFCRTPIFTLGRILAVTPDAFHPLVGDLAQNFISHLRQGEERGNQIPGSPMTWAGARVTRRWIESEVARLGFIRPHIRQYAAESGTLAFWATGQKPSS
jgi:ubiquinone/menaquinone biosynthesis C-methylase UbiE